jgi:glycosyltransferase involved in cell wall biosynthesis
MKILQIYRTDRPISGGAISMRRLHGWLNKAGVESKILCVNKSPASSESIQIRRRPRLENLISKITSRIGLNDIHCISSFNIEKTWAYQEADILQFHGIHGGYFSYLALPRLTRNKPAVFTLADMWAYTGHCAISFDCSRWKIGCGRCPYPDAPPAIRRDATALEWNIKNWVYSRSNLTIVTKGKLMTRQVRQSMLNSFPIHRIPNGIDTVAYQPKDPRQCRSVLGIASNKKVFIVAAMGLHHYSKGPDLLIEALEMLPRSLKAESVLILLGDRGETISDKLSIETLNLGIVQSDHLKALCYSAADLFLFPTRAESFGNVALESIACGTPVVAFRVGGVPDIVRPGNTGYLAEPENIEDFCKGMTQLLEDQPLYNYMSQRCREIVLEEYSSELHTKRYLDLYNSIIQQQ